jgi:pimeloyl-ACP methyl ester carboxylesterase
MHRPNHNFTAVPMKYTLIIFILLISPVFLMGYSYGQGTNTLFDFESFDNTRISYTDEGKGEAVILIHGFIVNSSHWQNTALKKLLLDKGYRVIIPDLRGNGHSDRPQNEDAYKNNAEVKDLIALADHLNLSSYVAIGYSRGSIVLAKLLTEETRITKAVLGGMGIDFTNPEWERRIAFADAFTGRKKPDEMTRGAIDYARSINADIRVLGFLQDYQPVTSPAELQRIDTETLVICGDLDRDNGDPEELKNQLPNSKLIIVTGDHNNTYKQSNFAEAIIDFLEE